MFEIQYTSGWKSAVNICGDWKALKKWCRACVSVFAFVLLQEGKEKQLYHLHTQKVEWKSLNYKKKKGSRALYVGFAVRVCVSACVYRLCCARGTVRGRAKEKRKQRNKKKREGGSRGVQSHIGNKQK